MLDICKDAAFGSTLSEMLVKEETYFLEDLPWILRNLTTKEFVRSEVIALNRNSSMVPSLTFWALAKSSHLLVNILICQYE